MELQKKIGENLKKFREKKELTQAEIARAADINTNYYAKIERGEANASTEMLQKLTKVLKIKSSDIFPF
ncbi:MAG TPA: helix-turn-helix transcriptional regulator [Candidatus Saccharimonadales bacterium]|nr:helix-turn-helix transcriptional regulator [Candidatus Saccharimonadales bacterium]